MKPDTPPFTRYIFFCTHCRDDREACGGIGNAMRDSLKATIKQRGISRFVRVSKAGCLGICAEGPHVLLMPDNILYKEVSPDDLPAILDRALEGLDVPSSGE